MDTLIDFILQLYTVISLLQFLAFSYRTIERVWIKKGYIHFLTGNKNSVNCIVYMKNNGYH